MKINEMTGANGNRAFYFFYFFFICVVRDA